MTNSKPESQRFSPKQFARHCLGRILTLSVAVAEPLGNDPGVNRLLMLKDMLNRSKTLMRAAFQPLRELPTGPRPSPLRRSEGMRPGLQPVMLV